MTEIIVKPKPKVEVTYEYDPYRLKIIGRIYEDGVEVHNKEMDEIEFVHRDLMKHCRQWAS